MALEVGVPCCQEDCEYCNPSYSPPKFADGPIINGSNTTSKPSSTRYNLCPRLTFRSSAKSFPHYQGTLQTALNHPARYCHKIASPPSFLTPNGTALAKLPSASPLSVSLSLTSASLLEPLSVALHAARRAQLSYGQTVLIFGAGAVGLLCSYVARQRSASWIVIADIDPGRVNFAVEGGWADQGLILPLRRGTSTDESLAFARENADNITSLPRREGFVAGISSLNGNGTPLSTNGNIHVNGNGNGTSPYTPLTGTPSPHHGHDWLEDEFGLEPASEAVGQVDVTFECTGQESCVQTSIYATKAGGKVMLVGMGTPVQTLPVSAAALREVDLLGVFRYAATYGEGREMIVRAQEGERGMLAMNGEIVTKRIKSGIGGCNGVNGISGWSGSGMGLGRSRIPDIESLVTHRFKGLEQAQEAFRMAGRTKDDEGRLVLKVMVELD